MSVARTPVTLGAINAIVHCYEGLYSKSPEPPYDVVPQLAEDDRTVVITVDAPTALVNDRLAMVRIAPRSIVEQKEATKVFDSKPVGSGPYEITSIARNLREVRFARPRGLQRT